MTGSDAWTCVVECMLDVPMLDRPLRVFVSEDLMDFENHDIMFTRDLDSALELPWHRAEAIQRILLTRSRCAHDVALRRVS